VKPAIIL